jgi:hypothetical protein
VTPERAAQVATLMARAAEDIAAVIGATAARRAKVAETDTDGAEEI